MRSWLVEVLGVGRQVARLWRLCAIVVSVVGGLGVGSEGAVFLPGVAKERESHSTRTVAHDRCRIDHCQLDQREVEGRRGDWN